MRRERRRSILRIFVINKDIVHIRRFIGRRRAFLGNVCDRTFILGSRLFLPASRNIYGKLCKEVVLNRSIRLGRRLVFRFVKRVGIGFIHRKLCKEIVFLGSLLLRLFLLLGHINCKCCKIRVHSDARTRNCFWCSGFLGSLFFGSCFLGSFLFACGLFGSCFLGGSLFFGSALSFHLSFSFLRQRRDLSLSISKRNYSLFFYSFFGACFFLFDKPSHFFFIGLYHFFCKHSFTFFTSYFFKVIHCTFSYVSGNVFSLDKINSAACFFCVISTVNFVAVYRNYKRNLHTILLLPN